MKTADEIIWYIETYYQAVTENPKGFYRDVHEMEDGLWTLERLYDFIVDDTCQYPNVPNRLIEFMFDQGFGAHGFSYGKVSDDKDEPIRKPPIKGPTDDEIARMNEFAALWRKYLSSGKRTSADSR